jgi:hypothetical protein
MFLSFAMCLVTLHVTQNLPVHEVNVLGLVSFYKLSKDGWVCHGL